jgi:hypothetical protein
MWGLVSVFPQKMATFAKNIQNNPLYNQHVIFAVQNFARPHEKKIH